MSHRLSSQGLILVKKKISLETGFFFYKNQRNHKRMAYESKLPSNNYLKPDFGINFQWHVDIDSDGH